MQPQLEGGDYAKPASTPAQGPEHIRLMIMIDNSCCAVCADDLEPHNIVDSEPTRARQPADAT
jgi:hypothetical protein